MNTPNSHRAASTAATWTLNEDTFGVRSLLPPTLMNPQLSILPYVSAATFAKAIWGSAALQSATSYRLNGGLYGYRVNDIDRRRKASKKEKTMVVPCQKQFLALSDYISLEVHHTCRVIINEYQCFIYFTTGHVSDHRRTKWHPKSMSNILIYPIL